MKEFVTIFATRLIRARALFVLALLLMGAAAVEAQTFRGGIAGRITDPSGAVLDGVGIIATNTATGIVRRTATTTTGDFSFPELPVGPYTVEAKVGDFQTQVVKVDVTVSRVTSVNLTLTLAQLQDVVEVTTDAITVDLQATTINRVLEPKQVQDLPLQGRDFIRMFDLLPGVVGGTASGSVNGQGSRGNNFQIDGADNNDPFQNFSAVNQPGAIGQSAASSLPLEAIDQFAVQSLGSAESGRNAGSTVNLVVKSGTNQLHGSAYYYNRHEVLTTRSPLDDPDIAEPKIRSNQYGFSLGGPIAKNKTFFFGTLDVQRFTTGNATANATAPSDAWLAQARQLLTQYGVAENPLSVKLLSLWPEYARKGPAEINNYAVTADSTSDSINGIIKVDHTISDRHSLSARYLGGGGKGSSPFRSPFIEYFDLVDTKSHNISLALTSLFTPRLTNQALFGYNYFKQVYDTKVADLDPTSLGLVTGSGILGAPQFIISNFSQVGARDLSGRITNTFQFTDTLSYSLSSHQVKFGGEVRRTNVDVFYLTGSHGAFNFNGQQGPWYSGGASTAVQSLADFLAGYLATATITTGPQRHDYYQNSFDFYAHDTWTINKSFSINYGLRYSYQGVLGASDQKLANFLPDRGVVSLDQLYPKDWNNFAPRAGFAWTLGENQKTVIRGGYGLYYNVLAVVLFSANGNTNGVGSNPGGENPVYGLTLRGVNGNFALQDGQPVFQNAALPTEYIAFGVNQNIQLPYVHSFRIDLSQQIGPKTVVEAGYVGNQGRHLPILRDINAGPLGNLSDTGLQQRRPYYSQYPELGVINQIETEGRSSYHSLQISLIQQAWRGLSGRVNYTLSRTRDIAADARGNLVGNPNNIDYDWAISSNDVTHVASANFSYNIPSFTQSKLGKGWQINTIGQFRSGTPITVSAGYNWSHTGDNTDRAVQIGDPYSNLASINKSKSGVSYPRYFSRAAFATPADGTLSLLERSTLRGPGLRNIDLSLLKTTNLTENTSFQLRAEVFNIFNFTNWSNPSASLTSTTFGESRSVVTTGTGAPRIVQLAVKFLF
ncbi:MAG: TonB-dependent receptor [Acidobacteriota bacterium]|jgi:hypothetical protein|nr:TonB-dependent receptor [Acidobacteriota bacterium]